MQTILPHEHHVEGFFLTLTQPAKIISGCSLFHIQKIVSLNSMLGMLLTRLVTHAVNRKRAGYLPNEAFSEPKSWTKEKAILIILI